MGEHAAAQAERIVRRPGRGEEAGEALLGIGVRHEQALDLAAQVGVRGAKRREPRRARRIARVGQLVEDRTDRGPPRIVHVTSSAASQARAHRGSRFT